MNSWVELCCEERIIEYDFQTLHLGRKVFTIGIKIDEVFLDIQEGFSFDLCTCKIFSIHTPYFEYEIQSVASGDSIGKGFHLGDGVYLSLDELFYTSLINISLESGNVITSL